MQPAVCCHALQLGGLPGSNQRQVPSAACQGWLGPAAAANFNPNSLQQLHPLFHMLLRNIRA